MLTQAVELARPEVDDYRMAVYGRSFGGL